MATLRLSPVTVNELAFQLTKAEPLAWVLERYLLETDPESRELLPAVINAWSGLDTFAEWYENIHFLCLILLEASED